MNKKMLSLPCWVSIPDRGGFFVSSPPVGLALQLLFVITNRETDVNLNSPDDRLFRHLIERWMGKEAADVFRDMLPKRANEYILKILFGNDLKNGNNDGKNEIVWEEVISSYALLYNVEPNYVLETVPFDRFLVFAGGMEMQRSREKLLWYDMFTLANVRNPSEVVNTWRKSGGLAYRTESGVDEVMKAHDEAVKNNPEERPAMKALRKMQKNDPK